MQFRPLRDSPQHPSHQYQEEFWKLKAQRLQAKNQELSKENQALIKKSIESSKREQELIDKLASTTILTRSRRNEDKQSQTAKESIQRLGKELRVLKNEHSMQMARAGEESKKLKRKVAEMEARQLSWVSADEHSSKIRALNEQITTLSKRLTISEQQLDRLREEKKKLLADIDSASKELNMAKAREKAVQKQEEENLINLGKYQQFIHQYKTQKQRHSSEHSPKQTKEQAQEDISEEVARLRKEISILQKERQNSRKMYLEIASWEHDKTRTEAKLKQMQSELLDARTELKNVLARLAPLIGQKSELKGKQKVEAKASLTLLQVFLKKYKIQAF